MAGKDKKKASENESKQVKMEAKKYIASTK